MADTAQPDAQADQQADSQPDAAAETVAGPGRVSPEESMAGILKAAGTQAAALALLNAVQHLQRTATLVEAATAVTLSNALTPGAETKGWTDGLEASRAAMSQAIEAFQEISAVAARVARG